MQDIGQLTVLLLLASFALERLVAAASFLLGGEPAADDPRGLRRRKLLLFALAGAVALAVVDRNADLRIMQRLQPGHRSTSLDYWLTWLVLVAGSDQVKVVVQWLSGNSPAAKEPKKDVPPIRIVVDDGVSVKSVA